MTANWKTDGADSLFLAYEPWTPNSSPFLEHAKELGIALPGGLTLETLAVRGWLCPRLRIALPPAAISACWNAQCDPTGSPDHELSHAWAHQLLAQCRKRAIELLPGDEPWKHWLESEQPGLGRSARAHVVDTGNGTAEPQPMLHPRQEKHVLPVVDFYADWQAYHLAELLDRAELREFVVTSEGDACVQACRRQAEGFDRRAQHVFERWKHVAPAFERLARFRMIWAAHARNIDAFDQLIERDSQAWATAAGFDAATIHGDVRDVLLEIWADWKDRPPLGSNQLRRGLQRDIGLATYLLKNLTGQPPDPFHSDWFWFDTESPGHRPARLIDALPNEEWRALVAFTDNASHRTTTAPAPFTRSAEGLWQLLRSNWDTCAPLRRFCLAWTRLMRDRLHDSLRHADATIAANERIEQFNLVGLHTERVVRHVAAIATPSTGKQAGSNAVMRDAIKRSLAIAAPSVSITDKQLMDWIEQHSSLHAMPDLTHSLCPPSTFATGDVVADQLIAAHVHALVARNYAAHHDYFDDKMIGTPAAPLLAGCLLVVVAALHSVRQNQNASQP
jgi:hypothetical protein